MGTPSFDEVNDELEELHNDPQTVLLSMSKLSAWVLLGQLQLALRHPENIGPTSEIARTIAIEIQEAICPDPESALARLAENGWEKKRIIIIQ